MKVGQGKFYFTDSVCCAESRRYYTNWLIRHGETGTTVGHKENGGHCDSIISIEELVISLDKQNTQDRQVNFLLTTQMIMPTRPKNVTERTARTTFFLPENAYVRSIRITGDK